MGSETVNCNSKRRCNDSTDKSDNTIIYKSYRDEMENANNGGGGERWDTPVSK